MFFPFSIKNFVFRFLLANITTRVKFSGEVVSQEYDDYFNAKEFDVTAVTKHISIEMHELKGMTKKTMEDNLLKTFPSLWDGYKKKLEEILLFTVNSMIFHKIPFLNLFTEDEI